MIHQRFSRGGSFGSLLFFPLLVVLVFVSPNATFASQKSSLRLLYFFNTSCNHCNDIKRFVFDLSKDYNIEGWISSAQNVNEYPFPVRIGSKEIAPKYFVYGVPSLVVLRNEKFSQLVSGAERIQGVKPLLRAFDAGSLSVTEVLEKKPGDEAFVTGFVKIEGRDMKDSKVFLIDHAKKLLVDPWLPREAVKSKFKKTSPRLLSHVAGKAVALKGKLVKGPNGSLRLQVREEVRYDQENAAPASVAR